MGNGNSFLVNGVCYASIKEAAEAYGLSANTVRARLFKGCTPEESVVPLQASGGAIPIEVNGKRFESIQDAAEAHDLPSARVRKRLKLGWTFEQALEIDRSRVELGSTGKVYLVTNSKTGKKYVGLTIRDPQERWQGHVRSAQKEKASGGLLHDAIRRHGAGAFKIEAVATAKSQKKLRKLERRFIRELGTTFPNGYNRSRGGEMGPRHQKTLTVEGAKFNSIAAASRAYGVCAQTVKQRLERGWSPEQSVGLDPSPARNGLLIRVDGTEFSNASEAARAYDLPPQSVTRRLNKGWTAEQALGLVDPPEAPHHFSKPTVIDGKRFESLTAVARTYGIQVGTLYYRLKNGWTLKQAVGLEPAPPVRNKPQAVVISGQKFKSLAQAMRALKIPKYKFDYRRKKGWSVEEALGLEKRAGFTFNHETKGGRQ